MNPSGEVNQLFLHFFQQILAGCGVLFNSLDSAWWAVQAEQAFGNGIEKNSIQSPKQAANNSIAHY